MKLLHIKQNYSPLYIKLKTISSIAKIGDLIYEVNVGTKQTRSNFRKVIDKIFQMRKYYFLLQMFSLWKTLQLKKKFFY